jgi:hypothetical protein
MNQETVSAQPHSPPVPEQSSKSPAPVAPPNDRIEGRWLSAGRVVWWIVTVMVLALTVASIPILYSYIMTPCPVAECDYQLTAAQIQQSEDLGLSLQFFAIYLTTILSLVPIFYILVGFFLFQRQSDRWIALLGAFTLVLFGGITFPDTPDLIGLAFPILRIPVSLLAYLGIIAFPFFVISFPDGRVNPRWSLYLIVGWILLTVPLFLLPSTSLNFQKWPSWAREAVWLGLFSSLVWVQVYRYRRLYGPVLRQQTKWVVFGLVVALGGFMAVRLVLAVATPAIGDNVVVILIINTVAYVLMGMIPLSIAIAILRYKLWDIDLLINRTLVYIPLTAILAGLYSATITMFQKIFIASTGQKSDAALVMATLVLATTFTPIRNGLQIAVDKRFKEPPDPLKEIKSLHHQVRTVVEVLDPHLLTRRMLTITTAAFHASGGAVYLEQDGQAIPIHATPGWQEEDEETRFPLEWNEHRLGWLSLGKREGGLEYSPHDRQILQTTANQVAQALAVYPIDRQPRQPREEI